LLYLGNVDDTYEDISITLKFALKNEEVELSKIKGLCTLAHAWG